MKSGIFLTKIWFDDDLVELRIRVANGESAFVNEVYVGHRQLAELLTDLSSFKTHAFGGIYDIAFGSFGPEFASGAFHARLHFQDRGVLFITAKSQSYFDDFGSKNVASEATFYLKSEPALLENFIREIGEMSGGERDDAALETI